MYIVFSEHVYEITTVIKLTAYIIVSAPDPNQPQRGSLWKRSALGLVGVWGYKTLASFPGRVGGEKTRPGNEANKT